MSKLEPHVLGSEPLSAMDEFLNELAEEAAAAQPIHSSANSDSQEEAKHENSVAESFIRLGDYLKKNQKRRRQKDRRSMALAAYQQQIEILNENYTLSPVEEDAALAVPLPYYHVA